LKKEESPPLRGYRRFRKRHLPLAKKKLSTSRQGKRRMDVDNLADEGRGDPGKKKVSSYIREKKKKNPLGSVLRGEREKGGMHRRAHAGEDR